MECTPATFVASKMETEATPQGDTLAASIGMRRRSHSVSDDYSVQRTNDDATQCKYAAVQLGYWEDEAINRFVSFIGETTLRRDPEISIGYWARIRAVELYVSRFIDKTKGHCQIVSLGCGFDTLFFRLSAMDKKFIKFVDVDFSSVTSKKMRMVLKPGKPEVAKYFNESPHDEKHCDLHCGNYHIVGADIRQLTELDAKLDAAGIDRTIPTLFLAECVLIYMATSDSSQLLAHIANTFTTAVFLNYEQFRTSDRFGQVMEKNLEHRGIQLLGLPACQSMDTQRQRFLETGWSYATVYDMETVFKQILDQDERLRICRIEALDEMELVTQLLTHYCLVHAVVDKSEKYISRLVQPEIHSKAK